MGRCLCELVYYAGKRGCFFVTLSRSKLIMNKTQSGLLVQGTLESLLEVGLMDAELRDHFYSVYNSNILRLMMT